MSNEIVKHIDVEGVVLPNIPLTNFDLIGAAKKLEIKNMRSICSR